MVYSLYYPLLVVGTTSMSILLGEYFPLHFGRHKALYISELHHLKLYDSVQNDPY
jgi:hypothetical protein